MNRAEVHEALFVAVFHKKGKGGIAIEGDVRDTHEIRARRPEELCNANRDVLVLLFNRDVTLGGNRVCASDTGPSSLAVLCAHGPLTVTRWCEPRKRMIVDYSSSSSSSSS